MTEGLASLIESVTQAWKIGGEGLDVRVREQPDPPVIDEPGHLDDPVPTVERGMQASPVRRFVRDHLDIAGRPVGVVDAKVRNAATDVEVVKDDRTAQHALHDPKGSLFVL